MPGRPPWARIGAAPRLLASFRQAVLSRIHPEHKSQIARQSREFGRRPDKLCHGAAGEVLTRFPICDNIATVNVSWTQDEDDIYRTRYVCSKGNL